MPIQECSRGQSATLYRWALNACSFLGPVGDLPQGAEGEWEGPRVTWPLGGLALGHELLNRCEGGLLVAFGGVERHEHVQVAEEREHLVQRLEALHGRRAPLAQPRGLS